MKNLIKMPWFWIIVVSVIIAGGIFYFSAKDDTDDVAISINDTNVSYSELAVVINQITQEFEMYGIESTEEEIREQAIERLIQQALLAEFLAEEGIDVSQEEINDLFMEIMETYGLENEEDFLIQLKEQGIESREKIDELLSFDVKMRKLIDLYKEEINISDEKLKETYDGYVEQMMSTGRVDEEIPTFEESKEEIREMMIQEELDAIFSAKLEELKEKAKINIY